MDCPLEIDYLTLFFQRVSKYPPATEIADSAGRVLLFFAETEINLARQLSVPEKLQSPSKLSPSLTGRRRRR